MPRELKRDELTTKDMSVMREADIAKIQKEKAHGNLRDYTLTHHVSMFWDLNDDAMNDKMFKLKIDDYEVILDWEEMLRYGRWI